MSRARLDELGGEQPRRAGHFYARLRRVSSLALSASCIGQSSSVLERVADARSHLVDVAPDVRGRSTGRIG
jgi:hypothetical protein